MRPPTPIGSWGKFSSRKLESGGWRSTGRFRDTDGVLREVGRSGDTRPKAEAALLEAMRTRRKVAGTGLNPETFFSEMVDFWSDELQGTEILPQTAAEYRRLVSTSLLPPLGHLRLRELTVGRVDSFLKEARVKTPSQARNLRSLLTAILAIAVRHEALEFNPVLNAARVPKPRREVRALDIDGALRLRAHARQFRKGPSVSGPPATDDLPDFIDLMLATGARIGEGLATRWQDIDLDTDPPTATFTGTVVYVKGVGYYRQPFTKSASGMRTVTLPPFAIAMLRRRKESASSEFIFPSRTGGIRQTQNMHRAWRSMREGTEWEWVTPHVFRKTVATLLDSVSGAETASKQLGHSSPEVTRRHYVQKSHIAPDSSDILEQLGGVAHLEGSPRPELDEG